MTSERASCRSLNCPRSSVAPDRFRLRRTRVTLGVVPDSLGALVGRQAERDALTAALGRLERMTAGVVQIAGEQGIGKTRLIAELCAEAEQHRYLVFTGRAAEFERGEAFGVFVDALDDYLASLDRHELESLDLELDELACVFPSLARLIDDPPVALPAERYRAHRAVRRLLDGLAGRRPLVLAVDDLHWADTASMELISYLLRRPPRGRVAHRDGVPAGAAGAACRSRARCRDPGATGTVARVARRSLPAERPITHPRGACARRGATARRRDRPPGARRSRPAGPRCRAPVGRGGA